MHRFLRLLLLLAALAVAEIMTANAKSQPQAQPELAPPEPHLSTDGVEWLADFIAPAFGVFLGVVAGAFVMFWAQLLLLRFRERQALQTLVKELKLNVRTLEIFLEDLQRLRNAVNANAILPYAGYFALGKLLFVTAEEMLRAGLLYKHLEFEDISILQRLARDFSLQGGEQLINTQVTQLQSTARQGTFNQADAVSIVDFWESKFIEAKKDLQGIITKVSRS